MDYKQKYNKYKKHIREYQNATNKWIKQHHLCKDCWQKDAYTLSGRTYCAECAAKNAERKREKRANNAEVRHKEFEMHKKWVQKKAEMGLCSHCGKRQTDGVHKTCDYCRAIMRKKQRERRAQHSTANYPRGENGYCWQCNKNMAMPGYKLCQECYNNKIIVSMANLKLVNVNNAYNENS